MPNPIIERAARALCQLDGHPENISFEGAPRWQDYVEEACAVLRAIREPSEEMIEAGAELDTSLPTRMWPAMIDAALGEE